jgi:hypothetical protein
MNWIPLKIDWMAVFGAALFILSGCDSPASNNSLQSTQEIAGLWSLKSVAGVALPENQTALLVILSAEPPSLGSDVSEGSGVSDLGCSGASVAVFLPENSELALVEGSLVSSSSERCFVSLPINQSAQLSLQQQISAGVNASLDGRKLVLTNIRGEEYTLELRTP